MYQSNSTKVTQIPILLRAENQTNLRQPRTYGPLMSLLLASLLTNSFARYVAQDLLPYEPTAWSAYNKPINHVQYNNEHHLHSYWQPIKNPYEHSYHYPSPTTSIPYFHDYPPLDTNYQPGLLNNLERPNSAIEPIASGSSLNVRRQLPRYPQRRYTTRRPVNRFGNRNPAPVRRRPTEPTYYDNYDYNYDDYPVRYNPVRKNRPYRPIRRPPVQNLDDTYYDDYDSDYEEDYDFTTKPFKRRRKPTKNKTKNRHKSKPKKNKGRRKPSSEEDFSSEFEDDFFDDDDDDERSSEEQKANTEVIDIKPRQQVTTEGTTGASTDLTSTTTVATATTTPASSNNTSPTGNGYGPSNGNEDISITYAPPLRYQEVPYNDWYTHEATRNAIVQKVHDIVGFEPHYLRGRIADA